MHLVHRHGLRASLARAVALLWLALFACLPRLAWCQEVQAIPPLSGRVVDSAGLLAADARLRLEQQLATLEQETGAQVVVLAVATTAPEDIAAYAQRVGEAWKLGRRTVGDGLLIVVASQDRRVRIEVAKALEGAVPDLAAKRIISESVGPAFKRGEYAQGLSAAIDRIGERVRAEKLGAAGSGDIATRAPDDTGDAWLEWLLPALIALPVLARVLTGVFGRKLGALLAGAGGGTVGWLLTQSLPIAAAAGLAAFVVTLVIGVGGALKRAAQGTRHGPVVWGPPGGWSGGGGGWSSGGSDSGGGFTSGGGGDFGGGGASGDW
ncbi:TPM domain-containing protein [Sphaerotilus microaerophilus]|uniref:TPM domain-containing protein n=1 Tax=Sphaerotilus microaerophilus TaxID=2914710 RepID=A0ABM7YTM9_9BURK|nr:TPM domain-containing protein [Sphaerotilus sp. FB-5]BDI08011.1 hypothetical protein CATMQ487_49810 [Sphaerotilus sp. FB-5]